MTSIEEADAITARGQVGRWLASGEVQLMSGSKETLVNAFHAYRRWAEREGHEVQRTGAFTSALMDLDDTIIQVKIKGVRCVKGIALSPFASEDSRESAPVNGYDVAPTDTDNSEIEKADVDLEAAELFDADQKVRLVAAREANYILMNTRSKSGLGSSSYTPVDIGEIVALAIWIVDGNEMPEGFVETRSQD